MNSINALDSIRVHPKMGRRSRRRVRAAGNPSDEPLRTGGTQSPPNTVPRVPEYVNLALKVVTNSQVFKTLEFLPGFVKSTRRVLLVLISRFLLYWLRSYRRPVLSISIVRTLTFGSVVLTFFSTSRSNRPYNMAEGPPLLGVDAWYRGGDNDRDAHILSKFFRLEHGPEFKKVVRTRP